MTNSTAQQLFVENNKVTTVGRQGLSQTAHLTDVSEQHAKQLLAAVNKDQLAFMDRVKQSMSDNSVLDKLIDELGDTASIDTEFLTGTASDELERMLKSQQSKRSRSRAKTMTAENYMSLVTAAISEHVLRTVMNKDKQSVGGGRRSDVGYTDEELQTLAADTEALAKAIRNVQSKKSIAKSKAGFDENSDSWKQLLDVESQLKGLRGTTTPANTKASVTVSKITDLIGNIDIETLKSADSKEILRQIHEAMANK